VKSFHHDHVAPYNNPLELSVDLVIGASSDGLLRLWKSHMGAVEDVDPYDWARVGSGAVWGGLPRTYIDPTVEQKQIALAAAYAVFFAKEYGGGCGKNTQLVVVPSDGFHQLGATDVLDRLDVLFRRYSGLEAQIRNYVLGLPCPDLFGGRDAATEQYRKLIDEVAAWLFRAPKSSGPRTSGAPQ
jgi:hypothetical protein